MQEIETGFGEKAKIIEPDSSLSFAKVKAENNRVKYYIKTCTFGRDSGHFYNKYSHFYVKGSEKLKVPHTGKMYYEYRQVPKEAFDYYLKFLETDNNVYLRNAERIKINHND